jgi:Mg-chelatase subunit ChlD
MVRTELKIYFSVWEFPMARSMLVLCLALCTVLMSGLAWLPEAPAAPAPVLQRTNVEIVFCIDTTGSMGGYLEFCKSKFWALCHHVASAKPTPTLKVGLVDYKDKGDPYITKVYQLTDDLDEIYSVLATLRADGGGDTPESVNQALDDAVNKMKWNKDRRTLRLIYLIGDAPPHMDYTDDVKYPVTCKVASKNGILINTIACGTDADCEKHWKEISTLSGGSFLHLKQSSDSKVIGTSHDRRMQEINANLLNTVVPWGPVAIRNAAIKKTKEAENLAEAIAADRLSCSIKLGRTAAFDLADCMRTGKVALNALTAEELPDDLGKLMLKERRQFLLRVTGTRAALQREARDLAQKRSKEVSAELAKTKTGFDYLLFELFQNQGKKFKMRY